MTPFSEESWATATLAAEIPGRLCRSAPAMAVIGQGSRPRPDVDVAGQLRIKTCRVDQMLTVTQQTATRWLGHQPNDPPIALL